MPLKVFIVLFFWVGIASFSWANPAVYTEPNPPFNFREKGLVQGLALDLLEASLATIRPRFS
ncbi:MAG: ABC transporter substrate-binding protein, partial [Epsilonproteobacteria bacterium]|nr:ABC transporter substrate-binding protein [Campylobacterota bacterium]